jgi:hypothetical protein
MKYILAMAAVICCVLSLSAKETERINVSFDIIEADKNVAVKDVLPALRSVSKRNGSDSFKYLAGGNFTLPPFTEEHFLLRQANCELELKMSWQPVITYGTRRINLKYKAALYFPMQKYSELQKSVEISSGTVLIITESDSENGINDTRPIRVLLGAGFIEPSYGFPVLGGIGAKLQSQSGYPFISEVLPGGAAKGAGLKFGDEITEVDGYSTLQMSLDKVTNLLRGDPGTKVKITIFKIESKTYDKIELIRQMLE